MYVVVLLFFFFFFNDTATTEIYTLSLHDALPIYGIRPLDRANLVGLQGEIRQLGKLIDDLHDLSMTQSGGRSEEHTSELQSQSNLVCRLLLEKKKKKINNKIRYKN